MVLVPVTGVVHGHVVGAEDGLRGQAVEELDLGVEGCEQAGGVGHVDVHLGDGDGVEVPGIQGHAPG